MLFKPMITVYVTSITGIYNVCRVRQKRRSNDGLIIHCSIKFRRNSEV